ncbi:MULTISPECIES: hypothetical protein [Dactylosporangium]|uniref:Uncharacterized protein n=2 Tax=Dactylosporangium TaxID=35753 RepID=A0A9W6KGP2_9ACTN|nr:MULTISPECIES: hypothetical protein [Dactylosporangium]UAB96617.1 hypothetical protein Dvina_53500 [Dactylosporangium vinaceum]UWZ44943.1 hypothetical protein Dmats_47895 [Dactylosporangium matsuzakiense]GLK99153.1 hypothetical protein GCM10017581_008940 [Dactylosporangium matsuzakiense]
MLWKKQAYDDELQLIADADTLAFGGVGIAGTLLPATKAYFAVEEGLRQHGGDLRPRLEKMLDKATPAGRVYAAELLTHADAAAGRAAWQKLSGQRGEVKTFTGCIMSSTTLERYAEERLRS